MTFENLLTLLSPKRCALFSSDTLPLNLAIICKTKYDETVVQFLNGIVT